MDVVSTPDREQVQPAGRRASARPRMPGVRFLLVTFLSRKQRKVTRP